VAAGGSNFWPRALEDVFVVMTRTPEALKNMARLMAIDAAEVRRGVQVRDPSGTGARSDKDLLDFRSLALALGCTSRMALELRKLEGVQGISFEAAIRCHVLRVFAACDFSSAESVLDDIGLDREHLPGIFLEAQAWDHAHEPRPLPTARYIHRAAVRCWATDTVLALTSRTADDSLSEGTKRVVHMVPTIDDAVPAAPASAVPIFRHLFHRSAEAVRLAHDWLGSIDLNRHYPPFVRAGRDPSLVRLYHGTHASHITHLLSGSGAGSLELHCEHGDFGFGFYVTPLHDWARARAIQRAAQVARVAGPCRAAVVAIDIPRDVLMASVLSGAVDLRLTSTAERGFGVRKRLWTQRVRVVYTRKLAGDNAATHADLCYFGAIRSSDDDTAFTPCRIPAEAILRAASAAGGADSSSSRIHQDIGEQIMVHPARALLLRRWISHVVIYDVAAVPAPRPAPLPVPTPMPMPVPVPVPVPVPTAADAPPPPQLEALPQPSRATTPPPTLHGDMQSVPEAPSGSLPSPPMPRPHLLPLALPLPPHMPLTMAMALPIPTAHPAPGPVPGMLLPSVAAAAGVGGVCTTPPRHAGSLGSVEPPSPLGFHVVPLSPPRMGMGMTGAAGGGGGGGIGGIGGVGVGVGGAAFLSLHDPAGAAESAAAVQSLSRQLLAPRDGIFVATTNFWGQTASPPRG
jgi:hypothetical protein